MFQYLEKEQANQLKIPPLLMTVKSFMSASTKTTVSNCEICSKIAIDKYCALCGYNFCGDCTQKRINNEIVCDYCFLKQFVKKSPLQKQEMFRSIEQATNKMVTQMKQYDDQIQKFQSDMVKIQIQQTSQKDKTEDVLDMQNKIKSLKQKYDSRKEGLEQRKKKLKQRKRQLEGRSQKNQGYEKKLDTIRKQISEKQALQLIKMQQLEKLKIQMETLDKERKQVLRDLGQ